MSKKWLRLRPAVTILCRHGSGRTDSTRGYRGGLEWLAAQYDWPHYRFKTGSSPFDRRLCNNAHERSGDEVGPYGLGQGVPGSAGADSVP